MNLRWIIAHRAWTPGYLIRYLRYWRVRLFRRDVELQGMVFIGRNVRFETRRGYGRIVIGPWVHIGDDNRLRCHEGTLSIGSKSVLGRDNTINCYLDVHIGAEVLISDWVYICDFDHGTDDLGVAIRSQGLVKSPVRLGDGCWIGTKASILRGSLVGEHSVIAAHAVVRGVIPAFSVAGGIPARVLRSRRAPRRRKLDTISYHLSGAGRRLRRASL